MMLDERSDVVLSAFKVVHQAPANLDISIPNSCLYAFYQGLLSWPTILFELQWEIKNPMW